MARLLGAGRIVATGRDDDALGEVAGLGADAVINTAVTDDELSQAFAREGRDGYDVVLDFLWGRPGVRKSLSGETMMDAYNQVVSWAATANSRSASSGCRSARSKTLGCEPT